MLSFIKRLLEFELHKHPFLLGVAIRLYPEEKLINDIYALVPNANPSMAADIANFAVSFRQEQGYSHILEYLVQPEQMKLIKALVELVSESSVDITKQKAKKNHQNEINGEINEETSVEEWSL